MRPGSPLGETPPVIIRPEFKNSAIESAEKTLAEMEQRFWEILRSEGYNSPFEIARISEHRQQYRDLRLFAEHPYVFALAKNVLDEQTSLEWGDRNGINSNTRELISFLTQQDILKSYHFSDRYSRWCVIPTARYMCVTSAVDRALVDPKMRNLILAEQPTEERETTVSRETLLDLLEAQLQQTDQHALKLKEAFSVYLETKKDVLGGRLFIPTLNLMVETLTGLVKAVPKQDLELELHLDTATLDRWIPHHEILTFECDKEELARRILRGIKEAEPGTLRYCALHATLPDQAKKIQRELQLRYFDPEGALLRMSVATSWALRKGGLRAAGLTEVAEEPDLVENLVERLRNEAIQASTKLLE